MEALPDEADRLTLLCAVVKNAHFVCCHLLKTAEFIETPKDIQYQMALLLNTAMMIWDDRVKCERAVIQEYKRELEENETDFRFRQVFMQLYGEAKKRGWVK